MGLLEKIIGKKDNLDKATAIFKTLTAYQPVFTSWGGKIYESERVRSAIDARARHISKLKIEALGSAQPKLQNILKKRPNNFSTWSQFLYRLSTILDIHNTAFILPVFDSMNQLSGYYPVIPTRCTIVQDKSGTPWIRYSFANGENAACKLSECGIMTRFQYKDDFFGESNLALDDTMNLVNMQNQGIKEAIKTAASYRFMAKVTNFTKAEDLVKERQRFTEENFRSDAKGGGLLLFPNTYGDIQQIKSTPYTVDADQMKLIDTNVFNYYGVNEDILQNKAFGDAWSAFYEGCIEVFAIQLSEVLTKMTFTDTEQSYGAKLIATANRLQYMSNADKLNVSAQMADRGIMTRNEIREIWNLPPIEGGDKATIRGEYYVMDENGNLVKENIGDGKNGEDTTED